MKLQTSTMMFVALVIMLLMMKQSHVFRSNDGASTGSGAYDTDALGKRVFNHLEYLKSLGLMQHVMREQLTHRPALSVVQHARAVDATYMNLSHFDRARVNSILEEFQETDIWSTFENTIYLSLWIDNSTITPPHPPPDSPRTCSTKKLHHKKKFW